MNKTLHNLPNQAAAAQAGGYAQPTKKRVNKKLDKKNTHKQKKI